MAKSSARPWVLIYALDTVDGALSIKRPAFETFEQARAAGLAMNPDLPGNGWVFPRLPDAAWEEFGADAYEQGLYYARSNRYAVVVNTTRPKG